MAASTSDEHDGEARDTITMPRPTAWPLALAAGVALVAAGVATSLFLSLLGAVIAVVAFSGWIGELVTGAGEAEVPRVAPEWRARPVQPSTRKVAPDVAGMPGHRLHFPETVHPYSAGAKGGLAGGVMMALVATSYGLVGGRGIWYPVNLLAAMILPQFSGDSPQTLDQFDGLALLFGTVIHLCLSVGVGLIFGIILPTLPRSPVFWGGVVGPLLWTGAIHSFMGVLNPVMQQNVDWVWFVASQFVYGLTVGIVVVRTEKVAARRVEEHAENTEAHDGGDDA
jgi:hypothetical protein